MDYDVTMLDRNLNAQVSYKDFFHALGYVDKEDIYLRTFNDRASDDYGSNKRVQLMSFNSILPTLHKENAENRGVFYIVNGDGNLDKEVKRARACFIDGDEGTMEEQLKALCEFQLEPSIIIKTRKSLHAYWITPDGEKKYFRELQERLIQYFGSDPTIKNESRVMRLYGFNHCKQDPVEVKLIKFDPQLVYTQRQLHEVLPILQKPAAPERLPQTKPAGEKIKHGQRHKYVVSRIGHYVAKLQDASETVIFQTVYTDFLENCEIIPQDSREEFEKRYMPAIRKYKAADEARATDPAFNRFAMDAWKQEHPGEDYNISDSTWDDVIAAGLRAKVDGKRIEEGYKARIESAENNSKEDYLKNSGAGYLDTLKAHIKDSIKTQTQSTGFRELDRILDGGLKPGLYFIGAISSLGKTTLMLQIADNIAQQGRDVEIFSLEMGEDELIAKSLSRITFLQADNERDAMTVNGILEVARYENYSPKETELIEQAYDEYSHYGQHVFIHEAVGEIGVREIRQKIQNHITMTGNTPVVFVDYLQVLAPYNDRMSDKQNVDKNVLELRRIARDFKCPVVCISSFNRASYGAGSSGRVSMSDFKESGAIEYSADVLIGLEFAGAGDDYNEKAERSKDPREIRLVILKNRNYKAWTSTTFKYHQKFNYFKESTLQADTKTSSEEQADFKLLGTKSNGKREKDRQKLNAAYKKAQQDAEAVGEPIRVYALAEIMDMTQTRVINLMRELGGYSVEKDGVIQVSGEVDTGAIVTQI